MGTVRHGGCLETAIRKYGLPRSRWIDLSTGINPFPYPLPIIPADDWCRLPEQKLFDSVLKAAQIYYGTRDSDHIIAAPGSQALIQWLPRLVTSTKVAIVGPTYAEHAEVWRHANHNVIEVVNISEISQDSNVIVLVNPDNPTGYILTKTEIDQLRRPGRLIILDEAFADVVPDISNVDCVNGGSFIILRSFGKFFGLAGVRLGFAIGEVTWIRRLAKALGPWAVSGVALRIAQSALKDKKWIKSTRRCLHQNAIRLDALLHQHRCQILGGTDLFRTISHAHAASLYDHLARHAILVRSYPEIPNRLRFGLPGKEKEWQRLKIAMKLYT